MFEALMDIHRYEVVIDSSSEDLRETNAYKKTRKLLEDNFDALVERYISDIQLSTEKANYASGDAVSSIGNSIILHGNYQSTSGFDVI